MTTRVRALTQGDQRARKSANGEVVAARVESHWTAGRFPSSGRSACPVPAHDPEPVLTHDLQVAGAGATARRYVRPDARTGSATKVADVVLWLARRSRRCAA